MFILGYPSPPATAAAISNRPTILYNCNVHGNEPQGRESCFIFARMLSFTEDPHLLEILSNMTVLIVPTINGNGRAGNDRGNETDADLNRDHALLRQPETLAFAKGLRDYTPDMALDLHEGDSEDLPILTSRHLNVYEPLAREGKEGLVEGWMYDTAAQSGWWHGPYHTGGDSNEGILRNTFGLKSVLGMLGENRASGGNTRPAEGTQLANRNRKSYGSLWEEFNTLEYFWTNLAKIRGIVAGLDRVPERERRPDRAPRLLPVGSPRALPGARPARLRRRPGGQPGPVAAEPVDEREHEEHGLRQSGADHRSGAVRLLRHRGAVLRAGARDRPAARRCGSTRTASRRRRGRPGTSSGSLSRCAA